MMGFMQTFDPVQIRYGGNEIQRLIELTILSAQRAEEVGLGPCLLLEENGSLIQDSCRLLYCPFSAPFYGLIQ